MLYGSAYYVYIFDGIFIMQSGGGRNLQGKTKQVPPLRQPPSPSTTHRPMLLPGFPEPKTQIVNSKTTHRRSSGRSTNLKTNASA